VLPYPTNPELLALRRALDWLALNIGRAKNAEDPSGPSIPPKLPIVMLIGLAAALAACMRPLTPQEQAAIACAAAATSVAAGHADTTTAAVAVAQRAVIEPACLQAAAGPPPAPVVAPK
jgi:hypothetical protein